MDFIVLFQIVGHVQFFLLFSCDSFKVFNLYESSILAEIPKELIMLR